MVTLATERPHRSGSLLVNGPSESPVSEAKERIKRRKRAREQESKREMERFLNLAISPMPPAWSSCDPASVEISR